MFGDSSQQDFHYLPRLVKMRNFWIKLILIKCISRLNIKYLLISFTKKQVKTLVKFLTQNGETIKSTTSIQLPNLRNISHSEMEIKYFEREKFLNGTAVNFFLLKAKKNVGALTSSTMTEVFWPQWYSNGSSASIQHCISCEFPTKERYRDFLMKISFMNAYRFLHL